MSEEIDIMSDEIDNKTRAAVLRDEAERIDIEGNYVYGFLTREAMRTQADQLESSEPKPGTYLWCQVSGCEWEWELAEVTSNGLMIFGSSNIIPWEEVERYKPASILEPGQVAVDRKTVRYAIAMSQYPMTLSVIEELQTALDRDKEAEDE